MCERDNSRILAKALGNMELLLIEEGKTVVEQVLRRRSQVQFWHIKFEMPIRYIQVERVSCQKHLSLGLGK